MRVLILPTLVSRRIHANLNIAFEVVSSKLVGLTLTLSKNYMKILETPITEVLARKSLLALGEGGGALSHLKLAKRINPGIVT